MLYQFQCIQYSIRNQLNLLVELLFNLLFDHLRNDNNSTAAANPMITQRLCFNG